MGYKHIDNLYKNKTILLFKQCYAMEKIHGTSTHLRYDAKEDKLTYFSGGCKHEEFVKIFNHEELLSKFRQNAKDFPNNEVVVVYGEGYGGKMQGMKHTYGPNLKFVAFEVLINKAWMSVPQAERFVKEFGLEFVHYNVIDTTEDAINAEMMADSVQAVRNGMGSGHMREGVILRPLMELVHQGESGGVIRVKHKRPEFAEREHTPKFSDPEQLKILEDAKAIADEWVVPMRLRHVLDAFPDADMSYAEKVIKAMIEDVVREAAGEIIVSKEVRKAIGTKTMKLFKDYLKSKTFT